MMHIVDLELTAHRHGHIETKAEEIGSKQLHGMHMHVDVLIDVYSLIVLPA